MCAFAATQLSQIGIEVEQLLACGLPFELTEELYRVLYIMTQAKPTAPVEPIGSTAQLGFGLGPIRLGIDRSLQRTLTSAVPTDSA